MKSELPSPQTTLVVLLGASEWPNFPEFQGSEAFANSASGIRTYLLDPQEFGLPEGNLLDLFDSNQSADSIDKEIGEFLERHILEAQRSGYQPRDVLIYFVGHGGFSRRDFNYFLAIRRTRVANPAASGIRIDNLAITITEMARHLRRIIILDCCFAASASKFFQNSEPMQVAISQTIDAFKVQDKGVGFPRKGTSLLCSSRHNAPSLISPDGKYTMFSQALLHVLHTRSLYHREGLSLRAVASLAEDYLHATFGDESAPRPEVHSPDQSEGDVANIPLFSITSMKPINIFPKDPREKQEQMKHLLEMKELLHARVIGQDEAIDKITHIIYRAWIGLRLLKRPIGSPIFLGPTGVGKTELVRALAEVLYGSEGALIEFEMADFMERHAAKRLIGAPPGYFGYEEGGELTEAVRRKPYSVILLDEIEKAHPDVFNILLQVLEDGTLTDARGRIVDFRNTFIIMTSNVGSVLLNKEASIGFKRSKDDKKAYQSEYEAMKSKIIGELMNTFKPELIDRFDEIIVFNSLVLEDIYVILDMFLKRVHTQLTEQQIKLAIPQATVDFLVENGFDPHYGARGLRRAIQRMVEDPLAEGIIEGKFRPGNLIEGVVINDKLILQVQNTIEILPAPTLPESSLAASMEKNIKDNTSSKEEAGRHLAEGG